MDKQLRLRIELSRLELINSIIDSLPFLSDSYEVEHSSTQSRIFDSKEKGEALNIIERWILTLCNDYDPNDVDPIFAKRKVLLNNKISQKFISECTEKGININFEQIATKVNNWIDNLISLQIKQYPAPVLFNNILKIPKFYIHVFPPDRIEAIKRHCSDLYDLAIMCVRYSCILQRGQQWTNSIDLYKVLLNRYNLDIEGFSSPLNSQLLQIKSDAQICTLFQDTDGIFGSAGSFFNQSYLGKNVAAFLPYVESIFDDVLELVVKQCEEAESTGQSIRFFIGTAAWNDTKIVTTLNNYKHTKTIIATQPYAHYFLDTKSDDIVISSFKNYYYVVSVNIDDTYDDLHEVFSSLKDQTQTFLNIKSQVKATPNLRALSSLFNKYKLYSHRKFICDCTFFNRILPPVLYREFMRNKPYSSHILYQLLSTSTFINSDTIQSISKKYSL